MRKWTDDNPKAGLLARKQAAIVNAARQQFLSKGFGGTTMEGVASAAGVSIATLYRHARTKDDLFDEVVRLRHDPAAMAEGLAHMAKLPLAEALVAMGSGMLGLLLSPETLATHRMVIAEIERFPQLGKVVHDAILGHIEETLVTYLSGRIGADDARRLGPEFLDRVIGDRQFLALLGVLPATGTEAERTRIAAIVAELFG
jgi:TetR/AcrR family transcriptional repressor of mexJK operon